MKKTDDGDVEGGFLSHWSRSLEVRRYHSTSAEPLGPTLALANLIARLGVVRRWISPVKAVGWSSQRKSNLPYSSTTTWAFIEE